VTGSPALALRGARVFVAGDALGDGGSPGIEAQQRALRAFEAWLRLGDGALVVDDGAGPALPPELTRAFIDVARGAALPVVAGARPGDLSCYAGVTAVVADRAAAQALARHSGPGELCDALLRASGAEHAVVALDEGPDGCRGLVTALAAGLGRGLELGESVALARAVAGPLCSKSRAARARAI
jgi:hypothetical protein